MNIRSKPLTGCVVATALALLLSSCGDDSDLRDDPDLPATTYVILQNGPFYGSITPFGDSIGRVSFAISETADSTHETVADGQVVIYDYQIRHLEIVLTLRDHPCGDTTVSGSFHMGELGPINIDQGDDLRFESDEFTIEGSVYGSADGTLTAYVTPAEGGEPCTIGPLDWSASAG